MDEYIKREKVYKMLHSFGGCGAEYGGCGAEPESWADGWDKAINTAISEMGDIPTADVRPERHGRWVRETGAFDKRDNFYHCSECHRTINIICGDKLSNYPYCHCGAKMNGEDGENNGRDDRMQKN